jgi:hypothetical protein
MASARGHGYTIPGSIEDREQRRRTAFMVCAEALARVAPDERARVIELLGRHFATFKIEQGD